MSSGRARDRRPTGATVVAALAGRAPLALACVVFLTGLAGPFLSAADAREGKRRPPTVATSGGSPTSVAFTLFPRSVRWGQGFPLRAEVSSPKGVPTGACIFYRVGARGLREVSRAPLLQGSCSARVSVTRFRFLRYSVHFTGDPLWSDSRARSRLIRAGIPAPQKCGDADPRSLFSVWATGATCRYARRIARIFGNRDDCANDGRCMVREFYCRGAPQDIDPITPVACRSGRRFIDFVY